MTQPEIRYAHPRTLVGKKITMSLVTDMTQVLWKSFMPERSLITNRVNAELISLQVFPSGYFQAFDPNAEFVKWALVEVERLSDIPDGMEAFILQAGNYAVFPHKGMDKGIFQHIYADWIPNSAYSLDDRPHFEVLGEKYENGSPESEEEIWIPITDKIIAG